MSYEVTNISLKIEILFGKKMAWCKQIFVFLKILLMLSKTGAVERDILLSLKTVFYVYFVIPLTSSFNFRI